MAQRHQLLDRSRWNKVAKQVKDADGNQCVLCYSDEDLTVDHIIPLSKMTTDQFYSDLPYDPDYLRTLCKKCNGTRQDRVDTRLTWFDRKWFTLK